jgi:indolepyruvate ferredoxin oxidoreductase beta subunit
VSTLPQPSTRDAQPDATPEAVERPTDATPEAVERPTDATPEAVERPTNVLIVGVGGQGVLMISKVLAQVCAQHGLEVKQSEVHGMAKRGGVVFSHVRFGRRVWSPTIPRGEADVVVALEWAEGLRWLPQLSPDRGTFLVDTRRIVPPFACRDRRPGARAAYPTGSAETLRGRVGRSIALDALGAAEELGNPRAANTVLLGALSTVLDFSVESWHAAIDASVPPSTLEVNRSAFEWGREWARTSEGPDGVSAVPAPESEVEGIPEAVEILVPGSRVRLEITSAWCKGCDICVKVCPERCLALDAAGIVEITDPGACTGCRVCEWLCPDFAIRVQTVSPLAEVDV